MNKSPGWWSGFSGLLFGIRIERESCADCRDDLERWKSEDVGPELAFKGPFLIRREDGYFMASLPPGHILLPESMEDNFQWQEVLAHLKEGIRAADLGECAKRRSCLHSYVWRRHDQDGSGQSMIDRTALLTKATKDPSPYVSQKAAALLEELKQEQVR